MSSENTSFPPLAALVGPTASGKTAAALALARSANIEIISADSMQVYRHMDIGTAKPTPDEQAQASFHGLDIVDPDQDWTLADFQSFGTAAMADIAARGRLPLIAGGTGLYVRALTTRLDIPNVPPDFGARATWKQMAETEGNAALHALLAQADPLSALRIHGNDVKRIVRALEVHAATGVPLSEWHERNRVAGLETNTFLLGLNFANRDALYQRINQRVEQMIQDGLLDEVQQLLSRGYDRSLKSMQSLGYRQLAAHLAGKMDLPTAIDEIQRQTRHFARRQLIWLRGDPRIHWLEAEGKTAEDIAEEFWVQFNKHTF